METIIMSSQSNAGQFKPGNTMYRKQERAAGGKFGPKRESSGRMQQGEHALAPLEIADVSPASWAAMRSFYGKPVGVQDITAGNGFQLMRDHRAALVAIESEQSGDLTEVYKARHYVPAAEPVKDNRRLIQGTAIVVFGFVLMLGVYWLQAAH
jgi:hypothetical protein